MAIRDTRKKAYIQDRDDRVFIGIDLPFRKSQGKQGWFASTSMTIDAIKNNIRNLLNTHQGERLMQPNLGLNLRKFLFKQIDEDLLFTIKEDIENTINFWLPFVNIENMNIREIENTIKVNIQFTINRSPNSLSQIQLNVLSINGEGMTVSSADSSNVSPTDDNPPL